MVDRKGNYDFMFSINTRSRSYFLAVDSRKEMDTWVNMVCKACGLKENVDDVEAAEAENSISQTPSVQNGKFYMIIFHYVYKVNFLGFRHTNCDTPIVNGNILRN